MASLNGVSDWTNRQAGKRQSKRKAGLRETERPKSRAVHAIKGEQGKTLKSVYLARLARLAIIQSGDLLRDDICLANKDKVAELVNHFKGH